MSYPFSRAHRGPGAAASSPQLSLFDQLVGGGALPAFEATAPGALVATPHVRAADPSGTPVPLAAARALEGSGRVSTPDLPIGTAPLGAAAERVLAFRRSPDLGAGVACTYAVTLGAWSEALLRTLLLSWGYDVAEPGPDAKFDLAVHVPPLLPVEDGVDRRRPRFTRIQVKATLGRPDQPRRFRIQQGYRNGGLGTRPYGEADFDLVAFVCLREEVVLFSSAKTGHHAFDAGFIAMMRPYQRDGFEAALHEVGALTAAEWGLLGEI